MFELHAVIISKNAMSLSKAKETSQKFIKDPRKTFYRETSESYRFRNIPKTKFSEFRSKVVNPDITLIYGKLK